MVPEPVAHLFIEASTTALILLSEGKTSEYIEVVGCGVATCVDVPGRTDVACCCPLKRGSPAF